MTLKEQCRAQLLLEWSRTLKTHGMDWETYARWRGYGWLAE